MDDDDNGFFQKFAKKGNHKLVAQPADLKRVGLSQGSYKGSIPEVSPGVGGSL